MAETTARGLGQGRPIHTRTAASKPTSNISLDFQVVVSGPTGKLDKNDAKKVRAFVMRQHHHKRKVKAETAAAEKDIDEIELQVNTGRGRPVLGISQQGNRGFRKIVPFNETKSQVRSAVLGFGRCDPFVRLPVTDIPIERYHELIDYNMTVMLPLLYDPGTALTRARDKVSQGTQAPLTLHVSLYAASSHLELLRSRRADYDPRSKSALLVLEQKGKALRAAYDGLKEQSSYTSDQMIHSILALAAWETTGVLKPDWSPFQAPLRDLQWLTIYSARIFSHTHLRVVDELIRRRGGLRNIRAHGVPWLVATMEMNTSAMTLDRPQHPLLDPYGQDISYKLVPSSSDDDGQTPIKTDDPIYNILSEPSGFSIVQQLRFYPDFLDFLSKIRHYSQTVEGLTNGTPAPGAPSSTDKTWVNYASTNRNWVIHKILCLPSASEILSQTFLPSTEFQSSLEVYEALRLTGLIYGVHVTYPTPLSRGTREKLLPLLITEIQKIEVADGDQALQEMLLWCLVIAGIAATRNYDWRTWYVRELKNISVRLGMEGWDWPRVKIVLRKFAWVDLACDSGGEVLWNESVALGN